MILVVGALLADIVILRDRGQHRNANSLGEGSRLTRAVILVDDHSGDADIAAELAEILHPPSRHCWRHRAIADRWEPTTTTFWHMSRAIGKAEAAADHVAKKVRAARSPKSQSWKPSFSSVSKPWMMPPPAAAAADLGSAKLHGEDAVSLEADIGNLELPRRRPSSSMDVLDDRRAGAADPTQSSGGRVALRIAADQQNLLAELGHHAGEVRARREWTCRCRPCRRWR